MSVAGMRDTVVSRLGNITGLRVYDHEPERVYETPAAVVTLDSVSYSELSYVFRVRVVTAIADARQAEHALYPYMEPTGAQSVRAAVTGNSPLVMAVFGGMRRRRSDSGAERTELEMFVTAQDSA